MKHRFSRTSKGFTAENAIEIDDDDTDEEKGIHFFKCLYCFPPTFVLLDSDRPQDGVDLLPDSEENPVCCFERLSFGNRFLLCS